MVPLYVLRSRTGASQHAVQDACPATFHVLEFPLLDSTKAHKPVTGLVPDRTGILYQLCVQ